MRNHTTYIKPNSVKRNWYVVDATGIRLGRLASAIAYLLLGKHKPQWQPNVDVGDHVIVINAEKVAITGRKLEQKFHYRHSGYPGNLQAYSYKWMIQNRPEQVVMLAVERMLPKSRLGRKMIKKLRVYRGPDHPHQAQQPIPIDISKLEETLRIADAIQSGGDE